MGLPDPRDELSRVEVTERLGDRVAGRSRQLKEGVDLVPAVSCQGHDWNRAESLEREIQVYELWNVGQLHDPPVERSDAKVQQLQREAFDPFSELCVGDALAAADHRRTLSMRCEHAGVEASERDVLPVAAFPVPGGEVRREGRDARQPTHSTMVMASACAARCNCSRPSSEISSSFSLAPSTDAIARSAAKCWGSRPSSSFLPAAVITISDIRPSAPLRSRRTRPLASSASRMAVTAARVTSRRSAISCGLTPSEAWRRITSALKPDSESPCMRKRRVRAGGTRLSGRRRLISTPVAPRSIWGNSRRSPGEARTGAWRLHRATANIVHHLT